MPTPRRRGAPSASCAAVATAVSSVFHDTPRAVSTHLSSIRSLISALASASEAVTAMVASSPMGAGVLIEKGSSVR